MFSGENKKKRERGEEEFSYFAAIGGRGTRAGEFPHMVSL